MKKLTLLALLTIFLWVPITHAEMSKEKRQEVEKMLRLTGMEKLIGQMKTQMISSLKTQMPQVPEVFWNKFQEKMDIGELIEKIIPVYDKYYTVDDLKAVNAFYESTIGQKLISTVPQVMQETMKIGQEWGQRIGKQAAEEAEQEMKKK